ncbi:MAG: hypothetical protein ACOVRM_01860, partial [Planctomycetaceae bacterium]
TDTAEKINYDGLVRLADLVTDLVRELAMAPERPAYVEVASPQFARGTQNPQLQGASLATYGTEFLSRIFPAFPRISDCSLDHSSFPGHSAASAIDGCGL